MKVVAETRNKKYQHLVPSAQFNVGQAHLQGFGITQSDDEAIRWWTLAAKALEQEDTGCIKSQNALGMMYSRNDTLNLKQVQIKTLELILYLFILGIALASTSSRERPS